MKLTKLLAGTVLSASVAFGATAAFADGHSKPVTVMSWGGAYTKSQVEAYHKPFTEKTGVKINSVDSDNPAKPIKAQVEAGNVTVDVADVEFSDAVRLCDEGLLEPIDASALPAAPDGTPASDDFIEGALTDCAVANIVWSTIYAYDSSKFSGDKPTTMADFFDTTKFPGKRGLRKSAKANLEMALMADGVAAGDVYIKFATATDQLAEQAKWISYGPARKSSGPLVGKYQDGKTDMGPQMPTAAANMGNALVNSFEFWADRDAELSERFNAWLNS